MYFVEMPTNAASAREPWAVPLNMTLYTSGVETSGIRKFKDVKIPAHDSRADMTRPPVPVPRIMLLRVILLTWQLRCGIHP